MPKYFQFMVAGYYLYFTSFCVVECMRVHASDRALSEAGSAKLFVRADGETVVHRRGMVSDRDLAKIQRFIKNNYREMYLTWRAYSQEGYFEG